MDTTPSKSRLLLVDGDPKSLRVLDVSLKKAGFDVATASSGRSALGLLGASIPDLIISDTDLDEMDGFELCRQIKARAEWNKIPFLFVSGRKSIEDKIRGLELGADDYLTKPIYIKEIGIRVRTALQRAEREKMESRREGRTRFAGDLSDVGVVDLLQTIELNRKSGIIHIVNRDNHRGSVFFRDGRVIDAEVGRLSGANAVYRLFSWSDGQFAVEFKQIRRHDVVESPMVPLLLEGMRRLDETTRLLEQLPSPRAVLEVDCRVLAEELAELPDEMNSVLRLCDATRTLQEIVEDSDHPDLEATTIIGKLFAAQIIFAREPPDPTGESEPGERLARWLSEGAAEDGIAGDGFGAPSGSSPAELAQAADAVHSSNPRSVDTLKGVPLESLFADSDTPRIESRASAVSDDGGSVAEESTLPAALVGTETRSTKRLGLAERMLSEDSAVRASAMHEAIVDGDGRITDPDSTDRNTREYGSASDAAMALLEDVVSGAHEPRREAKPAAEPGRPSKEVDWGGWSASEAEDPTQTGQENRVVPDPSSAISEDSGCVDLRSSALSASPSSAQLDNPGPSQPLDDSESSPPNSDLGTAENHPQRTNDELTETERDFGTKTPVELDPAPPDAPPVAAAEIPRDEAEIVVAPSATGFRRLAFLATAAFVLGGVGFVLLGRKGVTPASAIDPSHSFPTAVLPGPPTLPQETTEPAGLDVVATKRQAAPDVSDQHRKCLQVDADGKGKPKAVAKACRPAVEADPNDLDAIVILARAELDRGHLGEAKSLAKKALALDPNRFEAYIYLGNAEQEAGRIEEARAAYKKYLEFAPSGPFARELRAILSNL